MKKLIIAAVAAMFGIAVQAAQVNWSVNAIQPPTGETVTAGWIVQIYDSSVAFDYAKAAAEEITPWASGATVAAGTAFRAAGSTELANGTSKNIYAVIYDATSIAAAQNYIVSDVITISAPANGAAVPAAFGSMVATTTANKFLNATWTAAPEPTSGLLLLLGVAGLALKRKHA